VRLKHPYLNKTLGFLASIVVRLLRRTIDWRAVYLDPALDAVHPDFPGRCVFVAWHEYMLMAIMLRGGPHMLALASRHDDGEIITQAMQHLGWHVARGSSARGGTLALTRMLRDDTHSLIITPDGPRGPRRTFSPGAIYLASRLGLPLVCVGYGFERPWRLRSWDRFAIPRPFSRCRAVFGPAFRIPATVHREELERYQAFFERALRWLTEEAEAWAESGRTRPGELRLLPEKPSPEMLRREGRAAYEWPAPLAQEWAELTGDAPPAELPAATSAARKQAART
jgi:lysophospholipid acyltransferase (LPLAT)-like uncharacterized protein